jgi:hypothetical protein
LHSDSGFFELFDLLDRDPRASVRLLPTHSRRLKSRYFGRWMNRWYRARTMVLVNLQTEPRSESSSEGGRALECARPARTRIELEYGKSVGGIRKVTFLEVTEPS